MDHGGMDHGGHGGMDHGGHGGGGMDDMCSMSVRPPF
jgi:solute carrier family 31 (copper transporter), member 1